MPITLQLTGRRSFQHPLTYGRIVTLGKVLRLSDADGAVLSALINRDEDPDVAVFTPPPAGTQVDYDLTAPPSAVQGAGISEDAGNAIVPGTDDKAFLALKTVNGSSLVGSGDLAVTAAPAGSGTEIQYRTGSALGAMAGTSWDNATRSLSMSGATLTASAPIVNLSQTWNNAAVAFVGLALDAKDDASSTHSRLLQLRTNGADRALVRKDGTYFGNGYAVGVAAGAIGASENAWMTTNGVNVPSSAVVSFGNRVFLRSEAANVLSQRNGAAAQEFQLYNTFTDASNYERFSIAWGPTTCTLGTQAAGTGAARDLIVSRGNLEFYRLNGTFEVMFAANRRLRLQGGSWIDILENGAAVANPPANTARIFAEDDGTGKTRLMVRFGSGAAVQIAIEP